MLALSLLVPACSQSESKDANTPEKRGDSDKKATPDSEDDSTNPDGDDEESSTEEPESGEPNTDEEPSKNEDPDDEDEDPGDEEDPGAGAKFDLGAMPEGKKDKGEERPCEIDFLFVVDNSISMDRKQVNLINSVPKFIKTMMETEKELEKDYHIGVVTTDAYEHSPAQCRFLGGLVSQVELEKKQPNGTTDRKLTKCGPYKTGRNYMTHEDDLNRSFACAARPGRFGSAKEEQIGALIQAIDPKQGKAGKCNQGFIRDEALLVAVIISDEDAQYEQGGPAQWREKILAAKGNDEKKVVIVSIVVPKKNVCDPQDKLNQEGTEIIEFTKSFGKRGFVGDVCSPNYDPIFKEALGIIDFACGEMIEPEG